jgi:hypothetical protein
MNHRPPETNNTILGEFRAAAEELFPPNGYPAGTGPRAEAVTAFADILGIGADFRRLTNVDKNGPEMTRFLCHFQNNLDLLIQKTWVAKAEEARKEKLQCQIPDFIAGFAHGGYQKTLKEFSSILEELFYLLFGAQSYQEDFSDYIFRVDPRIGLFWWYGAQIGRLCLKSAPGSSHEGTGKCPEQNEIKHVDALPVENLWIVLLIGICYLTNF